MSLWTPKTSAGQRIVILLMMATAVSCCALLGLGGWIPGAFGQTAKPAPSADAGAAAANEKADVVVGSYSLVTTALELSETTHLLNPAIAIAVDGGTERAPGEFTGDKPVPAQYAVEKFGNPWYDCVATVAKLRGCEALDRASLTIRDANTIGYHVTSHGAAVTLNLNVEVHDVLPVSHGGPTTEWHAGEVIFVAVPKATPSYRFSSEVLVGTWNGEAIVFEVGKDLPEKAQKGLEDLGVKQDLGDRVLYGFKVKSTK
jgi:hypothetical protein